MRTAASPARTTESRSVLARFYAEADDGFLAERLGDFQPVQALNQHETRAIRTDYLGMLGPISSTHLCTSVPRRLTGT